MLLASLSVGAGPLRPEIVPPHCPEAQKICIQADRDGGLDMKSGTAYMVGNVVGVLKQYDLRFRSEHLKAFRNDLGEWARLELDQAVELEQPDRRATGDHAVIENDTGIADLEGSVTLIEPFSYGEGQHLHLDRVPPRSVLTGIAQRRAFLRHEGRVPFAETDASYTPTPAGSPQGPEAMAELGPPPVPGQLPGTPPEQAPSEPPPPFAVRPEAPEAAGESGGVPGEDFLPDTLLVTSDVAIYERDLRQAHFTGDVVMHRQEMGWKVWAEKVDLEFSEDQRLVRFDAEGNVRMVQPGRVMVANEAHSRNELDTIVLIGQARATQAGQFDLSSDRLEVYTSVQQGIVQSEDRQRPIQLTLDVGTKTPYLLSDKGLAALRGQGLPAPTLNKIAALRDKSFPSRSDFLDALQGVISRQEADLYRETIAEAARTGPP